MHPITKKENQLFKKRYDGCFFKDGLPSPQDYLDSNPKTLFIFRQANALGSPGEDLRKLKKSIDGNPGFWSRVARWCHGVKNIAQRSVTTPKLWNEWDKIRNKGTYDQELISTLQSFGFINLNKKAGGPVSKALEMNKDTNRDAIREQIALYKPDLIIACGCGNNNVFDSVRHILSDDNTKAPHKSQFRILALRGPRAPTYLVESHHPARAGKVAFTKLISALRNVGKRL